MREWYESRSFLELKNALVTTTEVEITPENTEAIANLYRKTMETDKNRELSLDCLSTLIDISKKVDWLSEAIKAAGKEDFIWSDQETFGLFLGNFPGKKLPAVLALTLETKGTEWYADLAIDLPHRLWKSVSKVLEDANLGDDCLIERIEYKFSKKQATADQMLWLWKSKLPAETKERLITHTNLFIIVSKPVIKNFIKARRQLIELISNNDKFLAFLLQKGDKKKVKSFLEHVQTYGSRAGIDAKRMQLRIADLFPNAQKDLEKNAAKKRKQAGPTIDMLITSPASYADYQGKLQEVNTELPENKIQIQRAREFGDFSENSELDAANERRDFLLARQAELTKILDEVKPFDFSEIKIEDTIELGTTVKISADGKEVTYHILGCWDSNPDEKIVSSGADLTYKLYGKKVGNKVILPNGKKAEILSISPIDKKIAKIVNTVPGK
ncbi:MAG: GreA/GreB family elongation factor [Lentisphaeria bacterium]|nr:GreA/GreB family elongation factor [Lentisphaeria bacterium]